MSLYQTIILERNQNSGRVIVRLNRPQVRNAMNHQMMNELTDCFEELHQDQNLRLIELQGEGKSFCSGADLSWMKSAKEMNDEDSYNDSLTLARLLETLEATPQPLVAKVHGAVMGGGLGIIACCDEVVAHEETKFRLPEVRIGLIPAMISPYIFSKMNYSDGLALSLSARIFKTIEAIQVGLVHRSYSDSTEDPFYHYEETAPKASRIAKAFIKEHYKTKQDPQLEDLCIKKISELRKTTEAQEGIQAVLNKSTPPWGKHS